MAKRKRKGKRKKRTPSKASRTKVGVLLTKKELIIKLRAGIKRHGMVEKKKNTYNRANNKKEIQNVQKGAQGDQQTGRLFKYLNIKTTNQNHQPKTSKNFQKLPQKFKELKKLKKPPTQKPQ